MSYNYGNQPPQGQQPRPYYQGNVAPAANPMQQQRPQVCTNFYPHIPRIINSFLQMQSYAPAANMGIQGQAYAQPMGQQYSQPQVNQPTSDPRVKLGWNQPNDGRVNPSNLQAGLAQGMPNQMMAQNPATAQARYAAAPTSAPSNQPRGVPTPYAAPTQQYAPQSNQSYPTQPYRGPIAGQGQGQVNPSQYGAASQPTQQQYSQYNPSTQQPQYQAPTAARSTSTSAPYDPFSDASQNRQPAVQSYQSQPQTNQYSSPMTPQPQQQVPRYGSTNTYQQTAYGAGDSGSMHSQGIISCIVYDVVEMMSLTLLSLSRIVRKQLSSSTSWLSTSFNQLSAIECAC
jgi:hypothetical protein